LRVAYRKGKGLRFQYLDEGAGGNASKPADIGINPGKTKDRHSRAGHPEKCGALPACEPYL